MIEYKYISPYSTQSQFHIDEDVVPDELPYAMFYVDNIFNFNLNVIKHIQFSVTNYVNNFLDERYIVNNVHAGIRKKLFIETHSTPIEDLINLVEWFHNIRGNKKLDIEINKNIVCSEVFNIFVMTRTKSIYRILHHKYGFLKGATEEEVHEISIDFNLEKAFKPSYLSYIIDSLYGNYKRLPQFYLEIDFEVNGTRI